MSVPFGRFVAQRHAEGRLVVQPRMGFGEPAAMRAGLLRTKAAAATTVGTITLDSYTRVGDHLAAARALADGAPLNRERQRGILQKINAIPEIIAGKRIIVVDDSIVRANSAQAIIAMLRNAGAAEVHLRISSPPIRWPCYFGVDLSKRGEIAAAHRTIAEMQQLVGADSLGYLSQAALTQAVGTTGICTGCFTGNYPINLHPTAGLASVR